MDLIRICKDAVEKANKLEWCTFGTSVHIGKKFIAEEENNYKKGIFGCTSMRTSINHELKRTIEKISGKKAVCDGDITFEYDYDKDEITLRINPLFLLCKYRKLARGISQTRWEKYEHSVEGYIVDVVREMFMCEDAILHGAGREDVDVRMLGDGRICVVEVVKPIKRKVDYKMLEQRVKELSKGTVEIKVLGGVGREYVWIIKEARFDKEYVAKVIFGRDINQEDCSKIEGITEIVQKTPKRVMHRRTDKARMKRIIRIVCEGWNGRQATFRITCEAGTYIKELITGDDGRTRPSFSEMVGCEAVCSELDVVCVKEYVSNWW
ncbi:MAG: tRNA pseudouridine(54/55) synthase Pus10 [Candidatus Micrarchaeia archaeon]